MSPQKVLQPSFSGGVFSPSLYSRVDLAKYSTGLRTAKNFFVHAHGGASNRQGTEFIAAAKYADKACRMVPFEFSLEQAYTLEMGEQYARIFKDGEAVANSPTVADFIPTSTYQKGEYVRFGYYMMAEKPATGAALFFHSSQDTHLDDLKLLRLQFATGATLNASLTSGPQEGVPGSFPILQITFSDTYAGNTAAAIQAKIRALGVDLMGRDFTKFSVTQNAAYAANMQYFYAGYPFLADDGWHHPGYGNYGYNHNPKMTFYRANSTVTGTAANQSIFPALTWDGQPPAEWSLIESYELVTPYLAADLPEIKITQSADVLYITHPKYQPQLLTRYANDDWVLSSFNFENGPFMPSNISTEVKLSSNTTTNGYNVAYTLVGVSASYARVQIWTNNTSCPLISGDEIQISGATGNGAFLNGNIYTLGKIDSGHYWLFYRGTSNCVTCGVVDGSVCVGGTASSMGVTTITATAPMFVAGHVGSLWQMRHNIAGQRVSKAFTAAATSDAIKCGKTWRVVSGGTWTGSVDIEKSTDGGTTWVVIRGFSGTNDFNINTYGDVDEPCLIHAKAISMAGTCTVNLTSDAYEHTGVFKITAVASPTSASAVILKELGATTAVWDWSEGSWSNYRGWPRAVTFHEDRLCFAGTNSEPQTTWTTQTGNYTNFGRSVPLVDSDGISVNLSARKMSGIKHLISLNGIAAMTSATEWSIGYDTNLTPTNTPQKCAGYNGCSDVAPIMVGNRVLYFSPMGSVLRDMAYSFEDNGFKSDDMTIMASHLFDGYTIVDMAYQQEPDKLLWCVRSDGKLLCLTYMREQEVFAWTLHETDGEFESVCSIPGDGYNEVWFVVKRFINGATVRYIERLARRMETTNPADQFFVDSGKTIVNAVATTAVTGLTHLIGETVAVLADGNVVKGLVVDNTGAITLPEPATKVIVGLPYTCDLETLNVELNLNTGTTQGSKVKISDVTVRFLNSRGGGLGPDADNLDDVGLKDPSDLTAIEPLHSTDYLQTLASSYDVGGRVFFRQTDPLPVTILAVIPNVTVGG